MERLELLIWHARTYVLKECLFCGHQYFTGFGPKLGAIERGMAEGQLIQMTWAHAYNKGERRELAALARERVPGEADPVMLITSGVQVRRRRPRAAAYRVELSGRINVLKGLGLYLCERCRVSEQLVDRPNKQAQSEESRREAARVKREWFINTIAVVASSVVLYELLFPEPRHPKQELPRGARVPDYETREGREYLRRVMQHEAWGRWRDRAAERAFKKAAKTAPERSAVLAFLRQIPINGAAMSAADDIELRRRERGIREQITHEFIQGF